MRRRRFLVASVLVVAASLAACGKKGPPLAPIQIVSTPIADLTARRLGPTVYLQFRVPVRNVIGNGPADIERVEVYAYTGKPIDEREAPIDDKTFLEGATLVGSADVRPPPPPVEEGSEATVPAMDPDDDRAAQGQLLTFVDPLTPESFVRVEPKRRRRPPVVPTPIMDAFWPKPEPGLPRYYVAVSRNRRNQASAATTKVLVSLDAPPPPPTDVVAHYSETAVHLSWLPPEGAPRLIQPPLAPAAAPAAGAAAPPPLTATPLVAQRTLYTYNLYDPNAMPNIEGVVAPINPTPLATPTYVDIRLVFGGELCYAVHTVEVAGAVTVESAPSATVCVAAVDTFRPSAPTRLIAVGSPGAISLLWEASPEDDVAGYVVLRGEAPDGPLEPITPTPVRESTYRDTTVAPGVRYLYAVLALDSETPPNTSLESNRVEESPRSGGIP